jgi:YD repeat-containing protein
MVVSGTSLYVSSAGYDALGRLAAMALGNGQQTQYVYHTATQQGGRLYQIKTGTSGAPDGTQYLQYGYDRVGNVTVITDHDHPVWDGAAFSAGICLDPAPTLYSPR